MSSNPIEILQAIRQNAIVIQESIDCEDYITARAGAEGIEGILNAVLANSAREEDE